MNTVEKFVGLVNAAHGNAVNKGWWEQERTLPELVALIHSEASEALEDYRAGKKPNDVWYEYKCGMIGEFTSPNAEEFVFVSEGDPYDSKVLGKPCGIPSELADIVIRVFDLVGKYECVGSFAETINVFTVHDSATVVHKDKSFGDNIGWLHHAISKIVDAIEYAPHVVYETYKLAEYSGIDLDAIIAEKMAYNSGREYRHGGKVL